MKSKKAILLVLVIFSLISVISSNGCNVKKDNGGITVDEIEYPDSLENDPDPVFELNNLTIGWIHRLPEMDYVWDSQNPTTEGWPAQGEQVIWRVFVKNWSSSAKNGVSFQWLLDGNVAASGTMDIPAGGYASTDFLWFWTFDRHILDFVVEPEAGSDNHLAIYTDALSLGLYVEQSVYDYFHEHQNELGIGSNSFEGWAQRQMRMWNYILETAIYPETPDGVLDRIRLDNITVVPDGSLPLENADDVTDFNPSQAVPNLSDRTVDMQWGFPVDILNMYTDTSSLVLHNQFFYSGFLQHELGHARYLIDVYGFDVYHGTAGGTIDIMENGALVAGSKYMTGTAINFNRVDGLLIQETVEKGMMGTDWTFMDRYSAVCMNRIAGHRATLGNFNAPENIGVFLNDLPEENRFTVMDKDGDILKNADIRIYQASLPMETGGPYPRHFDNTPDIYLTTDGNGRVQVGRCPFSQDGIIRHDDGEFSNAVFIMRVEHDGKVGYAIIDVSQFNLEYLRGNTHLGFHTVSVTMY